MPTKSEMRLIAYSVIAIAILTRITATRDLVIGKTSFF